MMRNNGRPGIHNFAAWDKNSQSGLMVFVRYRKWRLGSMSTTGYLNSTPLPQLLNRVNWGGSPPNHSLASRFHGSQSFRESYFLRVQLRCSEITQMVLMVATTVSPELITSAKLEREFSRLIWLIRKLEGYKVWWHGISHNTLPKGKYRTRQKGLIQTILRF